MNHLDAALEQVIVGALAFRQSWPQPLSKIVFVHHALVRQSMRKLTLSLKKKVWKVFKNL
jgi:hypothetical protein